MWHLLKTGVLEPLAFPSQNARTLELKAPWFSLQENAMTPRPDYGAESYKGTGKLADKIALITGADSGKILQFFSSEALCAYACPACL